MPEAPRLLLPTPTDGRPAVTCACCGEDRVVAALGCRTDVHVGRDCAVWLAGRLGITSTPTLPTADLTAAIEFYERAGFQVRSYTDPKGAPGGFAFVDVDGQSVFDLGVTDVDPVRNRAGCYLTVSDVDGWHTDVPPRGCRLGMSSRAGPTAMA